MPSVTLLGFAPPPRYDTVPFTLARIEESAAETGPWTEIAELALYPVDTDPTNPVERNLTTAAATLDDGWYRVTFVDADGGESEPSDAVTADESEPALWPTLAEVAAIIRARTRDTLGNELGRFTDETRPTAREAELLVDIAVDEIALRLPSVIPARYEAFARRLVAIRAAMLIELSYWPETVADGDSPYARLEDMFNRLYSTLMAALGIDTDEDGGGTGTPRTGAMQSLIVESPYSGPILPGDEALP